jgi:hypothetical protein
MTTLVSVAALAATLVAQGPRTVPSAPDTEWLSIAAPPMPAQADGMQSYLDVYVGKRSLDEDDWAPIDEPALIGIQFALPRDGLGWEIGFAISYDEEDVGFDFDATILEVYGGLHAELGGPGAALVPFFGVGLSVAYVDSSGTSGSTTVSDDDSTVGFYAHGGIAVPINPNLRIGADVRILTGTDVELFGVGANVDYEQLAFFIGFGV